MSPPPPALPRAHTNKLFSPTLSPFQDFLAGKGEAVKRLQAKGDGTLDIELSPEDLVGLDKLKEIDVQFGGKDGEKGVEVDIKPSGAGGKNEGEIDVRLGKEEGKADPKPSGGQ